MKMSKLKPNPLNPRHLTPDKKEILRKSLEEFGDISGIIFNKRSGTLTGGHQRSDILNDAEIKIVNKYDPPTPAGTVADGYAIVNGEKFSYREVSWDSKKETEAMLSANKNQGEWDKENLRILFADHPNISLELTGFNIPELEAMDITFEMPSIPKPTISDIVGYKDDSDDRSYLKNSRDFEEEADRERLPQGDTKYEKKPDPIIPPVTEIDPKEAFDKINETTTVEGKRIVLIIDCATQEVKTDLKAKLKSIVEEAGAQFF